MKDRELLITQQKTALWAFVLVFLHLLAVAAPVWAKDEGLAIKVMTLNLHNGRDLQGRDNLADFLELLNEEEPDLVVLQEVERRHLTALQSTGWKVAAGFNANRPQFRFGNVVMTPHRIVYERHHYLPGKLEQRGVNEVAVEIKGQYFHVLNTHLGLGRAEREGQMSEILRLANYLEGPILLTGDFNTGPHDQLFTMLAPGFTEAGNAHNLPNTFPLNNPKYRIDLIWYSADWSLLGAQVLPWEHSDHFPVTAELQLKTGTAWEREPKPKEIPDFDWQYNPLLPDVGRRSGAAEFSFRLDRERLQASSTRFSVPVWSGLSFTGFFTKADSVANNQNARDEAGFVLDYQFKKVDFRDYFSLMGFRGKAEFSLFAESNLEKRHSFGVKQYYRWNRLGTSLTTGFSKEFLWSIEGIYLLTDSLGWQLKLDQEGDFSTEVSYALNKHIAIRSSYSLSTEKVGLTIGFYQ